MPPKGKQEMLKMLMKGDLVKIPQDSRLTTVDDNSWKLKVLKQPEIAIILKHGPDKSTILLDNSKWRVDTKELKLYLVDNVH